MKKDNMADELGPKGKLQVKTGKRKLKNIKMYEDILDEKIEDWDKLPGSKSVVNQGESKGLAAKVEDLYNLTNVLNWCWDEGYLDANMKPKPGVTHKDVNAAIKEEFQDGGFFTKDEWDEMPKLLLDEIKNFKK